MRRLNLRIRFFLILVLLMLSIFGLITFVIVQRNSDTLRNNIVEKSKSFATLATKPIGDSFITYRDSGTIYLNRSISSFTSLDHDIDSVQITDTSGQVLYKNNDFPSIKLTSDQSSTISTIYKKTSTGQLSYIIDPYLETFGVHRYNIIYSISYASVQHDINAIVKTIVISSLIILLVSLIIWYFVISRLFISPVSKISDTALNISRGELNQQIQIDRNDEIGNLAKAVNTMANSLKDDIAKLRSVDKLKSEFLMIISHNLRTPLTIIQGYLDTLIEVPSSRENLDEELKVISSNVARLTHFSEDALLISNMEEMQTTLRLVPTDISSLLNEISKDFSMLASQKGIHFNANVHLKGWVNANKTYLYSAIWNVLDNSYKFTPKGGHISFNAAVENNMAKIEVIDSGIGISLEEQSKLFTKFHRGTSTLEYKYEGTGIGLYLTRLILDRHGATITFESKPEHGTKFTILIPTVTEPSDMLSSQSA